MMKQLRANSERVQRFAARPASLVRLESGRPAANRARVMSEPMGDRGFGNAGMANAGVQNADFALFGTDATTIAWTVKPVHTTAICTNGKYHTRRLQEMLT